MSPRFVATASAVASLVLGGIGLLAPQAFASAFGVSLDRTGEALARLACSSYVGFGVLAWLARDLTDASAWRAVAGASVAAWVLGAVVTVLSLASGLGTAQTWLIVAIQVVFAVAWSVVLLRAASPRGPAAPPIA